MQPFEQLEQEWARFNDLDPAGMVACSSGTSALHLACESMDLPLGSNVICPDFTMIACPRAISLAGMIPVFVDCDDKLLLDHVLVAEHTADRRQDVLDDTGGHFIENDPREPIKAMSVFGQSSLR